jgi:flagellar biosynthesis protein
MESEKPARRNVAAAVRGTGPLPKVIASGYGLVADEILALAFANGVKVREDADLAEVLAAIDLDTEVPLEALHAVCEILTYVYKANGQTP